MNQENNYQVLINKLDKFIRKFYLNKLIKGSLFTVAFVLILFLLFNFLEYQFFFSTGGRKLLFFSFIGLSVGALAFWVLNPAIRYFNLGKTISHEQAASIVGDHFTDVKDKLLNILQLKKQSIDSAQLDLITASINQKSDEIKLVPFKSAIDLGNNRQYLKYALPPFLFLVFILFAAPSIIKDSTHRIINNNKHFEKAAPFKININQSDFKVVQNQDFSLSVNVEGDVLPNDLYIDVDNYKYKLTKDKANEFSYTFKNVQSSQKFHLFSGDIRTDDKNLEMLPKPLIVDFGLNLNYPSYTGRKVENIQNIGDISVPQGTSVTWLFNTLNTDKVSLKMGKKETKELERRGDNEFRYKKGLYSNQNYTVYITNAYIPEGDSVKYAINVIPDLHPEINVRQFEDSLENKVVYLVGDASDDYGLSELVFHQEITDENGRQKTKTSDKVSADLSGLETGYDYILDLDKMELAPGDKVNYFFEIFDNDAVNGRKSSKTGVMQFAKPTLEEFEEMEDKNEEDIKDNLKEIKEESKKLKEEIKKMKENLLQKNELDWQDKKKIEDLMEKQKELQKMMQEAKEKLDENLKNQEEFSKQDEQMKEKQEKMQEMFEEAMDNEMKDLMEKIEELLQELNKEESIEMMEQFEMEEEFMEKNMERLEELFKQLEMEKELNEAIEELKELAEKEEKLSEETKKEDNSASKKEELKKEQEKITEEFEKLQEKMEELKEKNKELEVPKNITEDAEEQMDDIQKDMEKSEEEMKSGDNKKASESQKGAAQKMKDMAKQMEMDQESGEQEQMEEDMKALRQLLENIITLSFDQEGLVESLNPTTVNTPRYTALVQDQFKIKDDFEMVEDSLQALSKRVEQIQTFVLEKVEEINYNLEESIEQLEERQKPNASQHQRFTMKNLNDLALMLNESMQQMQQQQSACMKGNQNCNKPGSGSCNKPGGKGKGKQLSDKITKGQKELGEQLGKMKGKKGKGGKEGNSAKDFAEASAKQAALRKALEELQQENSESGKGSQQFKDIIDQMNKNEIDLVNKRLDNDLMKRQQDITSKLLEAEKAERQREYDNKRKAETTTAKKREFPPSLQEYIKKRESEIEMYKTISPELRPYYRNMVDEYYRVLKADK